MIRRGSPVTVKPSSFRRGRSAQPPDRVGMVNVMRPTFGVLPGRRLRQAERLVDGRGQVLRRLRVGRRLPANLVGGADHGPAAYASAGQEDTLDGPPVVPARQLVV